MSLFEQVKKDRVKARIAKDAVATSVLTTLVGELEGLAKRTNTGVSDATVVQICKKFIENNEATLQFAITTEAADELKSENVTLAKYVPVQLTADELRAIIAAMGTDNKGLIMKNLKANHAGLYDGAVASKIAAEFA